VPNSPYAARLRAIYDALPDMVIVLDRAAVIQEIHMGAVLLGQADADDFIGKSLAGIFEPEEAAFRIANIMKIFEQGAYNFQYESTYTGETRYLDARGVQLDEDRALIVIRDQTDVQRAFNELHASQAHLRAIYDAFPDNISISDRNGTIVEVIKGSAAPEREWDADLFLGKSFVELFPPEEAVHQLENQQRALEGEVVTTEYEVSFGPLQAWAESSGTRLDDEHVLWVTRDTTRRHLAEEELRASEDRYRTIVETAAEGIMALDADYHFTFVNERAEEMLGYAHGELIGKPLRDLLAPSHQAMAEENRARRRAGIAERFEASILRADGTELRALISARPRYDDAGNFAGSFSMVADISDLKRAQEEQRRLLQRVADAEDDERRRLAESLHDGPIQDLAAMSLRLGTLRLGITGDDERAQRVRDIEDAIRTTIGELRELMFALQPAEIGDAGLVTSLRTCIAVVFGDDEDSVELLAALPQEPPSNVASTTFRIAREALINARRHAGPAHVVIEVAASNDGLNLEVRDDGTGIPDDVLVSGAPGHLGLRTMRERAAAAGGQCTVERGPHGGTIVRAWLPFEAG
jgi:PAS domain S-box-containing protein